MDRSIAAVRGETIKCAACSRSVIRKSRQQRFCSDRCRDYARRENNARTAIKNPSGYLDSGQPTNPLFYQAKTMIYGGQNRSRAPR